MEPFFVFIKPILVLLILFLFILRLLLIALYQHRSGDYFSNRMFYRYSKMEIYNCTIGGRRTVMVKANFLTAFLLVLSILLLGLSVA